jgi:DNA-binding response OmpR family regulator
MIIACIDETGACEPVAEMRLLVIEDNPKMAALLRKGFTEQGHAVDVARNGHDGEFMAAGEAYDAIILDLMLPDQDGLLVCRNLRRRGVNTPILMLTALSTTQDKITGLDAGADDYLTKPFDFEELAARVRSLLRRGQSRESAALRFEGIEVDLLKRRVTRDGQGIQLSSKEFALLEYLLRNPNRVLTRTMIGEHVWDMNFEPDSNVIDVYISTLRRRVDRGFDRRLIHTVIGAGYMLSAEPPGV